MFCLSEVCLHCALLLTNVCMPYFPLCTAVFAVCDVLCAVYAFVGGFIGLKISHTWISVGFWLLSTWAFLPERRMALNHIPIARYGIFRNNNHESWILVKPLLNGICSLRNPKMCKKNTHEIIIIIIIRLPLDIVVFKCKYYRKVFASCKCKHEHVWKMAIVQRTITTSASVLFLNGKYLFIDHLQLQTAIIFN